MWFKTDSAYAWLLCHLKRRGQVCSCSSEGKPELCPEATLGYWAGWLGGWLDGRFSVVAIMALLPQGDKSRVAEKRALHSLKPEAAVWTMSS